MLSAFCRRACSIIIGIEIDGSIMRCSHSCCYRQTLCAALLYAAGYKNTASEPVLGSDAFVLVEPRGVEPLSENLLI